LESRSEIPGKFWNVVLEKDEDVSWNKHMKNEEVLHTIKQYSLIKRTKANWVGHVLHRNCEDDDTR
jgi:hypothetical protein